MLSSTHREVEMGFLDRLLGRGKEAAESAGDAAKDVGDKAEEAFDEAKSRVTGEDEGSDVAQSEERLDNVRDQALRDEGRMP
jgi:hypothetical protein